MDTCGSFLNANDIIVEFWKQYMSAYDSDDRKQFMQFYHDTATMTMIMMAENANEYGCFQIYPFKKWDIGQRSERLKRVREREREGEKDK